LDLEEKGDNVTRRHPLPLLLAGPILRRTEPEQVCIWIATSKPVSVRTEIFCLSDLKPANTYDETITKQPMPIGLGLSNSIRLGEHLYVTLVVASPIQNSSNINHGVKKNYFPTDVVLAYDIEFSDNTSKQQTRKRLKDLGLLNGRNTIAYNSKDRDEHRKQSSIITLPTFFIQADKSSALNIIHASCRKLHGNGEDCLAAADKLLATSIEDVKKRPSALFLTGDQIYADDVAGPIFRHLVDFGIKLLGWEEQIQGVDKKLSETNIGDRQQIINEHAGFSSDSAGNHLLSFGEYAAMYLLAWNDENWPDVYPDVNTIPKQKQKIYRNEIKQLEYARKALPSVRRILANIPTYMICDDHEVTDDWNITRESYERVKGSDCGKQVLANGLAAFWAFQGWGNRPDLYKEEFISFITQHLEKNGNVSSNDRKVFENHLLNFHGWTFDAPTHPLTIFLDTRTQRHYDSFRGPPHLLNEEGLSSILPIALEANYKKRSPIIIVSPPPVFGFELVEQLQEYLASKSSIYKWDLETWAANESGLIHFLSFILKSLEPSPCIFLSGDVHYAFTIKANFTLLLNNKESEEGRKVRKEEDLSMSILQLTSSPIKTTSLTQKLLIKDILARFQQLFLPKTSIRVGWNNSHLKSQKLKDRKNILSIFIQKIKNKSNGSKNEFIPPAPDWRESRNIIRSSTYPGTSLMITENNVGMVTVDTNEGKVVHKLLVRKRNKTKTYKGIVTFESSHSRFILSKRRRT
jgi:hypothetical protein